MAERGYTIKRTFDAPPEVVFEAWTDPEQFAIWFGTESSEMRDVELDIRPGGRWKGTMLTPDGRRIDWQGVYREVSKPDRLVMDLSDQAGDEYERYTATFTAHGKKTEMELSQTGGHLSDEEYEHARVGTDSFMDSLARCLPGMLKARHDAY
jgi:uncharacterized protein YndB with AHSA1/START domain